MSPDNPKWNDLKRGDISIYFVNPKKILDKALARANSHADMTPEEIAIDNEQHIDCAIASGIIEINDRTVSAVITKVFGDYTEKVGNQVRVVTHIELPNNQLLDEFSNSLVSLTNKLTAKIGNKWQEDPDNPRRIIDDGPDKLAIGALDRDQTEYEDSDLIHISTGNLPLSKGEFKNSLNRYAHVVAATIEHLYKVLGKNPPVIQLKIGVTDLF